MALSLQLTTQRTNKSSTFNSEGPSTSESQKKVSQAISYPHCTSCKGAEPSREACSRQYSPIIAPTMQDSHIQSPSSSPVKSSGVAAIATTGLQPQKERTFATGMSDDLHQQKPSIFQCVSIFAQRPNLIGRSSPGLNQFSLRHLDGPTCRSFALDHL